MSAKGQDAMDEVDLNNPLNWYISDAMDDYIGNVDSEAAKKMVGRNRAYSKLLQAVKDAADHLEATGHKDRAAALRQQIADLEPLA
jgi:ribosomal protein L13